MATATVQKPVRVPPELDERIRAELERLGQPFNVWAIRAFEARLEREKKRRGKSSGGGR